MGSCCAKGVPSESWTASVASATYKTGKEQQEQQTFQTWAKVVRVTDGDTVHLTYHDYGNPSNPTVQKPCRMLGINAPEKALPRSDPLRDQVIALADRATERLSLLILNQKVWVEFQGIDKNGRPLVYIIHNGINTSEYMLAHNLVVPYDGGTRRTSAEIIAALAR